MIDLNIIALPSEGWVEAARNDTNVSWTNERREHRTLDLIRSAPTIPPLAHLDDLRATYRSVLGDLGGIISVDVTMVGGLAAVGAIVKVKPDPEAHRLAYIGSLTFPFEKCSLLVRVQCRESGITGVRETGVTMALLDRGVDVEANWAADPYDATHRSGVLRNRADDVEWDAGSPDHPLSRVRLHMTALRTVTFLDDAYSEPLFGS